MVVRKGFLLSSSCVEGNADPSHLDFVDILGYNSQVFVAFGFFGCLYMPHIQSVYLGYACF